MVEGIFNLFLSVLFKTLSFKNGDYEEKYECDECFMTLHGQICSYLKLTIPQKGPLFRIQ